MRRPGRDALYALFYVGNQALALLTTIALIRYGQHTLTLPWVLGAILTLGWGTALYGMAGPTLAARLWSAPRRSGLAACIRVLAATFGLLFVVALWPGVGALLADLSGISLSWLVLFVALGLVRANAQTLSTFSVRHGRHTRVLRFQLLGRSLEIALALVAAMGGIGWLLVLAWLSYPLAQSLLLAVEWREYQDPAVDAADSGGGSKAWLATMASQAFDLVMPTAWLRQGGSEVFVAYRAVTSALANSTMLPRYWYVLSPDKPRDGNIGVGLLAAVLAATLILSAAFQLGSNAVPWDVFVWSLIPLLITGAAMPSFSRLRQLCLNQGQLIPPAVAMVAGRLTELTALLLTVRGGLVPGAVIVAYTGFAVCTPVLHYLHRRNTRCSTA